MIKQQQRVVVARRVLEVPGLSVQKVVILRDNPQLLIIRHVHALRRACPGLDLRRLERRFVHERVVHLRCCGAQGLDVWAA